MTQLGGQQSVADSGAQALDAVAVCRRLEPVIRLYALRRVGRADAVHDFVQESLLIMLEALAEGRLTHVEQVAPYAIGVCRNLLRDGWRSSERRRRLWEQHGSVIEASSEPSPYALPLGRARLEDCVSKLTRKARDVVRSAFFDEQSNVEIAEALGLAEGNVRVIRHRALEQLKRCLEQPISWSSAP